MSIASHSESLLRNLHEHLTADAGVQTRLGQTPRLYDHAPADPVFPYLTYGAMRSEDQSGDDALVFRHTLNLHVWSRYCGRADTVLTVEAVARAVETLTLDDTDLVHATVVYTDIFRAPDGRTLHGVIRLSVTTCQDMETQS